MWPLPLEIVSKSCSSLASYFSHQAFFCLLPSFLFTKDPQFQLDEDKPALQIYLLEPSLTRYQVFREITWKGTVIFFSLVPLPPKVMKKLFRKDFFRQKFFFSLFENSNFQAKRLLYICLCFWENPRNRVSNLVGPVSQSYPVSQPWVRDCFVWMSLNLFSVSPDSISVSFFLFLGSRLLCLRLLCVNESQSFCLLTRQRKTPFRGSDDLAFSTPLQCTDVKTHNWYVKFGNLRLKRDSL